MKTDYIIRQADINLALIRARRERSQEFHRIVKKIFAGFKTHDDNRVVRGHGAAAKFGA